MADKNTDDYTLQLNMPKICARCGIEPVESNWPIYSRYDFAVKFARTTYKKSRFYVPLCNSCKSQLEGDRTMWFRVSWISGIGILVMLVLAIIFYKYSILFLILSLLALTGFIFAYIKRSKYWGDSGIASYDGKYFTFNNKQFQEQFTELNPSLVRKP